MKTILSISLLLFTSTALACTNNPLFDICKQTATIASSQCDANATNPKCLCSAQKQLLACYTECVDDPAVLVSINEQKQKMQTLCDQPGAEAEVKMRKKNTDLDTMGAPIRITEPFKAKAKPQTVNSDGDGVMRASSQLPDQTNEPSVNEKDREKAKDDSTSSGNENQVNESTNPPSSNTNNHIDTNDSSVKSSGSVIHPLASLPAVILTLTVFYL